MPHIRLDAYWWASFVLPCDQHCVGEVKSRVTLVSPRQNPQTWHPMFGSQRVSCDHEGGRFRPFGGGQYRECGIDWLTITSTQTMLWWNA